MITLNSKNSQNTIKSFNNITKERKSELDDYFNNFSNYSYHNDSSKKRIVIINNTFRWRKYEIKLDNTNLSELELGNKFDYNIVSNLLIEFFEVLTDLFLTKNSIERGKELFKPSLNKESLEFKFQFLVGVSEKYKSKIVINVTATMDKSKKVINDLENTIDDYFEKYNKIDNDVKAALDEYNKLKARYKKLHEENIDC